MASASTWPAGSASDAKRPYPGRFVTILRMGGEARLTGTPGTIIPRAMGTSMDRLDGPAKVRGAARYAFEQPVDHPVYLYPLQATIAAGRVTTIDDHAAIAHPGVLEVLTYRNAARICERIAHADGVSPPK